MQINKKDLLNNYEIDLNNCTSLTLITSESCNLNCSYCSMANNINKKEHLKEAENVKQSFLNGLFIKNLKNIVNIYSIDCNKINNIDLWGQEPTLTLNEFSNIFSELYAMFPNLERLFFSTNGVAFPDRIVNLIKKVDSIVNKTFKFELQFSYDGAKATKESRGIEPSIIQNNVAHCINELNKISLKNTFVLFNFHNVISPNIINKYSQDINDNEFYEYLKELSDLGLYFHSLNSNSRVNVADHFSPGLINPYNATKNEGINLTKFMKKADQLGENFNFKWWRGLLYQFNQYLPSEPDDYVGLNIIPMLIHSTKNNYPSNFLCGCGFGQEDLKIRYDGTLIHCQNAIAVLKPSECLSTDNYTFKIQSELAKQNYYPNLLNQDDLSVFKFFERAKIAKNSAFPYYLSETLNLLALLIHSNQIDESYKYDKEKLFHHAMILSQMFICWDNNLNQTGSGFGRTAGEVRFMCNGFLDLVDEAREEFIKMYRNNGGHNDN